MTDGLLVVDKTQGITSHDVVDRVRRALAQTRVGHAGTLDPLATGVLPVAVGAATRLIRFLPSDPKVYRVTARLGLETTTGDIEGVPVGERRFAALPEAALEEALGRLRGVLLQLPPMFSAKKVDGVRLYRSARAGREVAREPVRVSVHELRVLRHEGERVELEVHCSPGTYVRTLVVDLGRMLGVGATVEVLRRLRSGAFGLEPSVSADRLGDEASRDAAWIPLHRVPLALPVARIDGAAEARFVTGRAAAAEVGEPGVVAVRSPDGRLVGIGERESAESEVRPVVVLTGAAAVTP